MLCGFNGTGSTRSKNTLPTGASADIDGTGPRQWDPVDGGLSVDTRIYTIYLIYTYNLYIWPKSNREMHLPARCCSRSAARLRPKPARFRQAARGHTLKAPRSGLGVGCRCLFITNNEITPAKRGVHAGGYRRYTVLNHPSGRPSWPIRSTTTANPVGRSDPRIGWRGQPTHAETPRAAHALYYHRYSYVKYILSYKC